MADEFNYTTPGTGSQLIGASNISPYTQYCTGSGTPPSCSGTTQISNMIEQYEIVPFSSDYWSPAATLAPAALNTSSNLVKAVNNPPYYSGAPSYGAAPPWGIADRGGEGTFYAGIITAAENALIAEQAARTAAGISGTQNVIILLSDGDATATGSQLSGYSTSAECTQAVTAAQAATRSGTLVYAVAYGAQTSGCTAGDCLQSVHDDEGDCFHVEPVLLRQYYVRQRRLRGNRDDVFEPENDLRVHREPVQDVPPVTRRHALTG